MQRNQKFQACLCALILSATAAVAAKVTSLWVFGDDYVDMGAGAYVPQLKRKCTMDPYGQNQAAATGRCSNGNIITDQLAKQMGTVIGPFAGPEAFKANGVNFAAAGSGALGTTNPGQGIPLETQWTQFKEYIKQKGYENRLNDSLILISFGMNDYLQAIMVGKDPMAYVDRIIAKIVDLVKRIRTLSAGYRFVIMGVPPLGCLPLTRNRFFAPPETCLTNLNAVNEQHEKRLAYNLDALVSLQPKEEPLYYSLFLLSAAFADKTSGMSAFKLGWDVACGILNENGTPIGCGQNVTYTEEGVQKTAPVMAKKMSGYDYFFWDWLNPTENAHYTLWVAMWLGNNPATVYPMSVVKLYFM